MDFKESFNKLPLMQRKVLSLKFKTLDTDELRVIAALNVMKIIETKPEIKCETKDSSNSLNLRKEGNQIFILAHNIEEFMKAWQLYTISIAKAPNGSEELSLAYANRSALLLKLCKYSECIEDINRALVLNLPSYLKLKLLYRKIECLCFCNKTKKVNKTINEIISYVDMNNLYMSQQKIKKILMKAENLTYSKAHSKINLSEQIPTYVPHKKIPCASEILSVKFNEKFGRHLVTTSKVEPGQILIVEQPYANILLKEVIYSHCSNCMQVYWAMIPCEFCVNAMYCSDKCKNEAWERYHDIECSVTSILVYKGFDKCKLFAMRLAILALREAGSVEKLKYNVKNTDNCIDLSTKSFTDDGIFYSNKYYSLYTLVTNTEKRSVSDLFDRAMDAANILYYLCTCSVLFGKKFDLKINNIIMNKDATYIGGLILRHLQIISNNIHSYEEEFKMETVEIGATALPFCSLINHSCNPNVSRITSKDKTIVFAIVPIEKDSQIYDCYGSHYAIMNKFERQEKLKQFFIDCECIACREDWPTYLNLLPFNVVLKSAESKKMVEDTLKPFYKYMECASEDKVENKLYVIKDIARMINIIIKNIPQPCYEINNLIECLKKIFVSMYGNKYNIPDLFK